ncbi:hypothetical protein BDV18DRAFT_145378 [Aspergillus unguis]
MPSTKPSTKSYDDASSTYAASTTSTISTITKEKQEAKRNWLSKIKGKSDAGQKNKDAALHYEAMAHYMIYK